MSAAVPDVCTLVWPFSRLHEDKTTRAAVACATPTTTAAAAAVSESGSWIVGWNPRGLSVVVATLLPSMPYAECVARLRRVKAALAAHATPPDVPRYRDLQVLGYLRAPPPPPLPRSNNNNAAAAATTARARAAYGGDGQYVTHRTASAVAAASTSSPIASTTTRVDTRQPTVLLEHNVRRLRQRRSIWVELHAGPVLGEVWCFGYRVQPCQLHVLRVDADTRLHVKPLVFSATALYSAAALRQLRCGTCAPICVAGALSSMEGVVLPPVLLRESAPQQYVCAAAAAAATAVAAGDNSNRSGTTHTDDRTTSSLTHDRRCGHAVGSDDSAVRGGSRRRRRRCRRRRCHRCRCCRRSRDRVHDANVDEGNGSSRSGSDMDDSNSRSRSMVSSSSMSSSSRMSVYSDDDDDDDTASHMTDDYNDSDSVSVSNSDSDNDDDDDDDDEDVSDETSSDCSDGDGSREHRRAVSALRADMLDVDVECSHTHSFIRPELPPVVQQQQQQRADEACASLSSLTPDRHSHTRRSTSTHRASKAMTTTTTTAVTPLAAAASSLPRDTTRHAKDDNDKDDGCARERNSHSCRTSGDARDSVVASATSRRRRRCHCHCHRRRRRARGSGNDGATAAPTSASAAATNATTTTTTTNTAASSSVDDALRTSTSTRSASKTTRTTRTRRAATATTAAATASAATQTMHCAHTTRQAMSGVPPRLDFPCSIEQAEMSITLAACRAGRVVHHALRAHDTTTAAATTAAATAAVCASSSLPRRLHNATRACRDDTEDDDNDDEDDACRYLRLRVPHGDHGNKDNDNDNHDNNDNDDDDDDDDQTLLFRVVVALLSTALTLLCRSAAAMSVLSRYSFTAGVMELRVRELANFVAVVLGRSDVCGLHPVLPHALSHSTRTARRLCVGNYVTRQLVDVVLGLQLSMLLSVGGAPLHAAAQAVSRHFLYVMHMSYMNWFAGYPAGLKVNEDLNSTLCFLAKCMLNVWDALSSWRPHTTYATLLQHVVSTSTDATTSSSSTTTTATTMRTTAEADAAVHYWWALPSYYALVVLSMLGASVALAFVADLAGVVSVHLRLLYRAMAVLFRVNRVLLGSLYRQFRGQRYNPLRHRLDAYDFRLDQMLHATCLFAIGVFLFPTLAVYFVYFAVIRATVHGMQAALVAAAYAVLYVPLFPLLYWCVARARLSGGVVLDGPVVTQVRATPTLRGAATGNNSSNGSGGNVMVGSPHTNTAVAVAAAAGVGAATLCATANYTTGNNNNNNSSSSRSHNYNGSVSNSGMCVGGGSAAAAADAEGDGLSHTVELTVCALPLPLRYLLSDYVAVLQTCVQLFAPVRVVLPLFTRGTIAPATDVLAELVPHLRVDCVQPPCTLGVASSSTSSVGA